MRIVGITGTHGAGKGAIVDYLLGKGFAHYSARDLLTEEIRRRGMPEDRNSMHVVSNSLRAAHGPEYIAVELYKKAAAAGRDAVIESLRTEGEVDALRAKGNFVLIAVDADPKLRYERIVSRGTGTDKVTFEEFKHQEDREMHATDPTKHNGARCIEIADYKIMNEGALADLRAEVDRALERMNLIRS